MVSYLPNKYIYQLKFSKYMSPLPPDCTTLDVDIEWIRYPSSILDMSRLTCLGSTPYDVDLRYLEWYYRMSHPQLVLPTKDEQRAMLILVYDDHEFVEIF